MSIGMFLHRLAPPHPRPPSFQIDIKSTISSKKGTIQLVFYTPSDYRGSSSSLSKPIHGHSTQSLFPVIVNFHGGGFVLGSPTDDARWASAVTENVGAVFVSVGYRLAPEHPFPVAVEDGVDAILWLYKYGRSLGIDSQTMGLSGFSAGANLCFTVALRLETELKKLQATYSNLNESDISRPCVIVSWYPGVDWTLSRAERRALNPGGPNRSLPKALTNLFDASYIYPPETINRADPYLSPGTAPDYMLTNGLPKDIILYTCQYDQLFIEGEAFRARLEGLGKNLFGRPILRVRHGWDRSPNPFKVDSVAKKAYLEASTELNEILKSQMLKPGRTTSSLLPPMESA